MSSGSLVCEEWRKYVHIASPVAGANKLAFLNLIQNKQNL